MQRKPDGCPACGQAHDQGTLICPITGVSLRFSDPNRAVGQVIGGKYRITGLLGRGGMGAVYEAEHQELGRRVAIKILLPESSGNPRQIERFKREARSAASIGHENIVQIFDLDTSEDGSIFIVMEHLQGTDLADLLQKTGRMGLGWKRAASIGSQAARGLGAAHEHSIVHRDLKPENIFIVADRHGSDMVKVVDFGIAMMREAEGARRLTAEGVLIGTPFYMSPEQARGERELDARTDIYALGTVMYEMLTGTVLFDGDTYLEILAKHQVDPPAPMRERCPALECPAPIESLIYSMLQKERSARPQSMADVAAVLDRLGAGASGPTPHDYALSAAAPRTSGFERTMMAFGSPAADEQEPAPAVPGSAPARSATPVASPTLGWSSPGDRSMTVDLRRSTRRTRIAILSAVAAVVLIGSALAIAVTVDRQGGEAAGSVPEPPEPGAGSGHDDSPSVPAEEDGTVEIRILASPAGARISVDGEEKPGNPVEMAVPGGKTLTVLMEAEGYSSLSKVIAPEENATFEFELEELQKKKTKATIPAEAGQDLQEPEENDEKGRKKIKVDKDNPYLTGGQ